MNQIYSGPSEAKSGSEYAKMVPKKGNITAHSRGLKDFHPELVIFFLGGLNYTFLNTNKLDFFEKQFSLIWL